MKRIVKQIAGTAGKRPASSILNPAFVYTNSAETNLSEKFARIRALQNPQSLILVDKKAAK